MADETCSVEGCGEVATQRTTLEFCGGVYYRCNLHGGNLCEPIPPSSE